MDKGQDRIHILEMNQTESLSSEEGGKQAPRKTSFPTDTNEMNGCKNKQRERERERERG